MPGRAQVFGAVPRVAQMPGSLSPIPAHAVDCGVAKRFSSTSVVRATRPGAQHPRPAAAFNFAHIYGASSSAVVLKMGNCPTIRRREVVNLGRTPQQGGIALAPRRRSAGCQVGRGARRSMVSHQTRQHGCFKNGENWLNTDLRSRLPSTGAGGVMAVQRSILVIVIVTKIAPRKKWCVVFAASI